MSNLIPRRRFLKGVGSVVALPMLEAMMPLTALAQSVKKAPNRMAFMFTVNGVNMDAWTPAAEGANYDLPFTLEPLANVKDSLLVMTGLTQHNAFALGDGPGDHARSTATWLTGVHCVKTAGDNIHNGVSVDQVAAQQVGGETRFPSLELGCERGAINGDCDSGYSCAYSSNISWHSDTMPMAKEINPRLAFQRLFGGDDAAPGGDAATKDLFKQSVLDAVMGDANSLKRQLGTADQQKLDEYFDGVRDIENRIAKMESAQAMHAVAGVQEPEGIPNSYNEHIQLMTDIMVLAFQADLTRISTFMLANDGSNRSFREIGIPEGHHDISHHAGDPVKLDKKKHIDRFHIQHLAYMLEKMKGIKELDGTLLDHAMVVFGAGISDGNRHNHDNLPILLAGRGCGTLKTGRHLVYPDGTPLNNLYVSMLGRMNVPIEHLGDSTGKLTELF